LVDLGRGAGLHLVDLALLFIDHRLPLIYLILLGVGGMLLAIDLQLELIHAGLFSAAPVHQILSPVDFGLRAIHVRLVAVDSIL
jgi:hypothetical protein